MRTEVRKGPKVSLCRECGGTGEVTTGKFIKRRELCPQCEGSGRVIVESCGWIDVKPYRVDD